MLKLFIRWFTEVQREGTPDDWATGMSISFVDKYGKTWHLSGYMDPKHWNEPVKRGQIVSTRNEIIKRMKRLI